jgi:hypothetical protein
MKITVIKAFIDREVDMLHRKTGAEFKVNEPFLLGFTPTVDREPKN